jgi:carbamoyl-phosphate synthase large subunit
MKSVGEAMAIGRTFAESLQKALRSLETGLTGLRRDRDPRPGRRRRRQRHQGAIGTPTPDRCAWSPRPCGSG